MSYFFIRFAYPWLVIFLLFIIVLVIYARHKLYKRLMYRHSLGAIFKKTNISGTNHPHRKIRYGVHCVILFLLAIVIGKPQLVDSRSKVPVQGIDLIIVLDVSGSMQLQDYEDDPRSRFDVAKSEAIRFIEKRDHDALGLVLFGGDAVSRCPITSDKVLLKEVVQELKIGTINSDRTMLVAGIVTAANRLKHSVAKSKVMIVLTDGEPSEGDVSPSIGIDIAKKMGIKIYTIGIGSEEERVPMHPLYGMMVKPKVNRNLLTQIAVETGGRYFMASSASDMRSVYDTIDALEKTEHEVPVFTIYYELVVPFVMIIMGLCIAELIMSTFIWFAL